MLARTLPGNAAPSILKARKFRRTMATEDDADDERLMRRAIAESRLAVEEDNAMVSSQLQHGIKISSTSHVFLRR